MRFVWIFLLFPVIVFSKPKGGKVTHGNAEMHNHGNDLIIQTSEKTVINWEEFSILQGEKTQFIQPHSNSAVLNRVQNGISHIDGLLKGNGRVYLINPQGIIIGKEGVIQTGGFIGSTLDLNKSNFLVDSKLYFRGKSQGRIMNMGKIEALGGDIFLLAKGVVNEGLLKAQKGVVGIAAADEVLLKPSNNQKIFILSKPSLKKGEVGIENEGVIEATRAELRADGNAFRLAINQGGIIEATGTEEKNGRVYLVGNKGITQHSGTIIAEGGEVHLLGKQVGILETGKIDVSSEKKGGKVLIGGDYQGKNRKIQNSKMSFVLPGGKIFADATEEGNGGEVIVWSDENALMQGTISARGGRYQGDGGFVEVSGLNLLDCSGYVDTSAPYGKKGNLLLDPTDITIFSTGANVGVFFNSTTGVYEPISATASIANMGFATALQEVLQSNMTDITVQTTSPFNGTGNIQLVDGVVWSSSNSLIMLADNDIAFIGGSITNTADASVTLIAAGDISVSDNFSDLVLIGGNVNFTASRDIIIRDNLTDVEISSVNGSVNFNAGRDIILGIATPTQPQQNILVESTNGAISFFSGRNTSLIGTDSAAHVVLVSLGGLPNSFIVGGDLTLRGGIAPDTSVQIGGGGNKNGNMTFTVGGNVSLEGGTGTLSFAQIGYQRGGGGASTGTGDITFTTIDEDLLVASGTGVDAYAQIGHVNGTSLTSYTGSGDVTINVQGDTFVVANTSSAIIGHGNKITGGTDGFAGSIRVSGEGLGLITASDNGLAAVGFAVGGAGTSSVTSDRVEFSNQNLTISGADGNDGYVGLHVSDNTDVEATIGSVNVTMRDNLTLNPGTVSSFTFDGSAAIGAYSEMGSVRANVNVTVTEGDLLLNGSSGAMGSFSRIVSSSSALTDLLQVNIQASNLFIANGSGMGSSAEIFSSGTILAISDFDTILHSGTLIHTNTGSVTLVVDNAEPEPPEIGDGRFIIESGAMLSAGSSNDQPLRIFTARRTQNTIEAPLNGAIFVPGQFLINSATEQWAEYFPDNFGGIPFTIFYKTGIPGPVFNEHGSVISEMFQNLKTYDELLFCFKYFLLGYDKACYDQLLHPKGMVSSFDLFDEEKMRMLRQNYRNYHTKYVESF